MSESNKNDLVRAFAPPVAPEDYLVNKAKIAEAKALISAYEEMNEAGKESHDVFTRELEQKIKEGEQARLLLEQLKSQSTTEVPPLVPIQSQAIDYPSGTSRIEEVPNYNPASGQVKYQQFQGGASNQQPYNSVPQVTTQSVGNISYQQWTPPNAISGGQSQQPSHQMYSQYSQQNIMQNSSSRAASYAPFGFPAAIPSQHQPMGQDHSRPMAPAQEHRRVPTHQEPLQYGIAVSNQGQRHSSASALQGQVNSSPQTVPAQVPGPSSHAAHMTRFAVQFAQQPSSTQKFYSEAAIGPNKASASGTTYRQGPPSHGTTNVASQFQPLATTVAASQPVTLVQSYASSSTNPKGHGTNQSTTHGQRPLQLFSPTTLPSNPTQFREAIKSWEIGAPSNSYFQCNDITVFKDSMGITRLTVKDHSNIWTGDVDQFCYAWRRRRNVNNTTSVPPTVSANSAPDPSSNQTRSAMSTTMHTQGVMPANTQKATPLTVHKGIPSTAHKATTSKSEVKRPDLQPGASSSKQSPLTTSTSMRNPGSTSQQTTSSTSHIQLSPPSTSATQLPPSSISWASPSVSETPSRQLSTIVNGVPRFAKQADKKFLASHILFGLGKRSREPDMSPTALTVPKPKRQETGEVGVGVSPSASYKVGQADQAVQQPNAPLQKTRSGPLAISSQQQCPYPAYAISNNATKVSGSSLDQQWLAAFSTSKAATTEIPKVSKVFSGQMPSSLPETGTVQATLPDKPHIQVPLQDDSQQKITSDDRPVTSDSFVPHKEKVQVPLPASQADSQREIVLNDHPVTSAPPHKQDMRVPLLVTQADSQREIISEDRPVTSHLSVPHKQNLQVSPSQVESDFRQEIFSDERPVASDSSVPLAIPTAQASTPPAPVLLTKPVAVLSLLSPENITQPIAPPILEQLPHPNTLGKTQRSFIDVTSPVPSPLVLMASTSVQTPQEIQPLFLPSPLSSSGLDVNDDISISRAQSPVMASASFDLGQSSSPSKRKNLAYVLSPAVVPASQRLHKSSSLGKRKNRAYVLAPFVASARFNVGKSSSPSKWKKNRAYVMVPPPPTFLVKYLQLEKPRASWKRIRLTPWSSVSTSVAVEEDFYSAPENRSPSSGLDAYEQQAVKLSCSRLQKLPCKWNGCSVIMNSVDALIRHLTRIHQPSPSLRIKSFLCRWTQCGRRFNMRERHLETHATLRLDCPYEDCDECFRSARPLWKHMRAEHENDKLKPSAQPSYPKLRLPGAIIPRVIPSYIAMTRVNPDAISSARHEIIGPRVLRNIAGLKSKNKSKNRDEDASNDYDFLIGRPTRYSSELSRHVGMQFEDLNSANISRMVDEGLTLWGSKSDEEWEAMIGVREPGIDQDEM